MAVKKSELYSKLWESCDELRGGMDPSQYKDYVLVLLFIKYISDKYYKKRYAPIVIPRGASFKDLVALKGKPNIGHQINKKIRDPLMKTNTFSSMPDFNDPVKLGSGKEMVERLTNLISIFEDKGLDFSKNRADGDDILGDAYEYFLSKFAIESGKSKGQFYTPAEVSRVIAKIIGIGQSSVSVSTTVYDPTCGSGSLLLKIAEEAEKNITLYGQEKDSATSGLAQMNMVLHNYPTASIIQGNTLADPKFKQGKNLKTFDYVVANPPFSDKKWKTGLIPESDEYDRFKSFGIPPNRKGDYAYLLHIVSSLNDTGKGACILPHGALFRGNTEYDIRRNLVHKGYIKAVIGLPKNLFYGTGIPACIIVIDKKDLKSRKGIFMINASNGFRKEGPKNRLLERDIHYLVNTYKKKIEIKGYSRMVSISEVENEKNNFNLNLTRYVSNIETEDLQDIEGHICGGIPDRDVETLSHYWKIFPSLRNLLFKKSRPNYNEIKTSPSKIKTFIKNNPEIKAYNIKFKKLYEKFITENISLLKNLNKDSNPKIIIKTISESLLSIYKSSPLIDGYKIYQHLMDYWLEKMQDDLYLIISDGWYKSAQSREIIKAKNKNNKLVWPEEFDYLKGKQRFKTDFLPLSIIVSNYFKSDRDVIKSLDNKIEALNQQLMEMIDEYGDEDGLLTEVIEGDNEKQKITLKRVKEQLKKINKNQDSHEEFELLQNCAKLLEKKAETITIRKITQETLEKKIDKKYPNLTVNKIKNLVVENKWLFSINEKIQEESFKSLQDLISRILVLAKRYKSTLPQIKKEFHILANQVDKNIQLLTGEKKLSGFRGKWEKKKLGDLLEYEQPTKYIVNSTKYRNVNEIPVLTAGKTFILGYTDETYGIFKNLPVIIFDDFTAATKYVEFPFKVKSSAMKILKPRNPSINLKLVYEMMQLLTFQVSEHKRHWISEYQKLEINFPCEEKEQFAIVKVISEIENELSTLELLSKKKLDIKQGLIQKLLTDS